MPSSVVKFFILVYEMACQKFFVIAVSSTDVVLVTSHCPAILYIENTYLLFSRA
jgi:hypothetical protein